MTREPLIDSSFWDHVDTLRKCLLRTLAIIGIGMLATLIFYKPLFAFLTQGHHLVLLGPLDGTLLTLKTAFWLGLVGTFPLWGLTILQFVLPALTTTEKRLILPFAALSLIFLALGLTFGYTIALPLALKLLSAFNATLGQNLWTLTAYLSFTLFFVLAQGLAAELFVLLLLLVHTNIISPQTLKKGRRYAVLIIFILSAILTPPDIVTQALLALPLLLLYEVAILYGSILEKKRC